MRILLSLCLVQEVCANNVPDFKKTLQAAGQGYAKAQFNLGLMYYNGQGDRQDYVQAAQWYHKAAEQGLADAQYNLGEMYYYGRGIRQNHTLAKEWFGKACQNGLQQGCEAYRHLDGAEF